MHVITQACHHEPEYVMEIDGVCYHGADKNGALSFIGDLMVNFTRDSDIPSACDFPELAPHIVLGFEEEVMVPWPDFSIPLVRPSFWEALHKFIKQEGWDTVCFHCEAGHGRTGTALASMLVAIQGYTPAEAVWHVRTHYCEEAVETGDQCDYLIELDEYYNDREAKDNDELIPSMVMVIAMARREAAKKAAEAKKRAEQEDKYEGFKGVVPR